MIDTPLSGIARVLDRVSALIDGGVVARRAWELAFESTGFEESARRLRGGASVPTVLDSVAQETSTTPGLRVPESRSAPRMEAAWRGAAAVWRVAERTGAPVSPTLAALSAAMRAGADADRASAVALAGPAASARIVLVLPLVGVALGAVTGADTLRVLMLTPVGWGCMLAATALVIGGRRWSSRMVQRAAPEPGVSGILLEAWAVALSGGGSRIDAERAIRTAFEGAAAGIVKSERAGQLRAVDQALDLADHAGVPAGQLLRRAASDLRRDAAAQQRVAIERLAVRLVVPLGVCVLPAFVLVGVVPMLVGIFSSTTRPFE